MPKEMYSSLKGKQAKTQTEGAKTEEVLPQGEVLKYGEEAKGEEAKMEETFGKGLLQLV